MGILLMPVVFVLCWEFEKVELFDTIEDRFKSHKKVTLRIAARDVAWIKLNREIIINGTLFDVSSIRVDNQQVIITGYFDAEEDEINKRISSQATGCNEKNCSSFLSHYLMIFNSVSNQNQYSYFNLITLKPSWNRQLMHKVISPARKVATPPPNCAGEI